MRVNRWKNFGLMVLLGMPGVVASTSGEAERRAGTSGELEAAVKASRPGDEIVLRDGPWRNVKILFEANETAERPITLRAETPGRVVLSGRSRLRIAGSRLVVAGLRFKGVPHPDDLIALRSDPKTPADHCRLTDCAVVGCDGPNRDVDTR